MIGHFGPRFLRAAGSLNFPRGLGCAELLRATDELSPTGYVTSGASAM